VSFATIVSAVHFSGLLYLLELFIHNVLVVNGRLRCLGSGQHLRNRFGSGYEVDIKTHPASPSSLQALAQYLIDQGAIRFASLSPIMDMSIHMRASDTSLQNQELAASAAAEPMENAVSAGGVVPPKKSSSQNDAYLEELMKIRISGPLHTLCSVLGNPNRAASLAPGCDGQLLHDQLLADGFVTLRMFLEWWIAEEYFEAVAAFMLKDFNGAPILLERSAAHSFRYRIPISVTDLPLADIFEKFERVKARLFIKDYAVGQTTLEQIFNQFASSQDNPEVEAEQLRVERQQQLRSTRQA
jgi:ATP-binding cassette, subfamily A (ABC1), member 3